MKKCTRCVWEGMEGKYEEDFPFALCPKCGADITAKCDPAPARPLDNARHDWTIHREPDVVHVCFARFVFDFESVAQKELADLFEDGPPVRLDFSEAEVVLSNWLIFISELLKTSAKDQVSVVGMRDSLLTTAGALGVREAFEAFAPNRYDL